MQAFKNTNFHRQAKLFYKYVKYIQISHIIDTIKKKMYVNLT